MNRKNDLGDIIDKLNIEQLRELVRTYVADDERARRALVSRFGRHDPKDAARELREATTSIKRSHERGGFIEWRDALDFEHEYLDALDLIFKPFVTPERIEELIELNRVGLIQLQRIRIDDSDGFFTAALGFYADQWGFIYDHGSEGQRRALFDALRAFTQKNPGRDRGDVYWFERGEAAAFLRGRFADSPAYADDLIAWADENIRQLPVDLASGGIDLNEYSRSTWQLTRLQAMRAAGCSRAEMFEYAHGLLDTPEILQLFVDDSVGRGDLHEAADLLAAHLSVRPWPGNPGRNSVLSMADQLIDIYEKLGEREKLVSLLRGLLTGKETGSAVRASWYERLRELLGEGAWRQEREGLLDAMDGQVALQCLAAEGELEELYRRGLQMPPWELMRFEKNLAGLHPEYYLERYRERVYGELARAGGREAYRRAVGTLQHMLTLEGGRVLVEKIAADLRERYPRRRAMLEELDKLHLG